MSESASSPKPKRRRKVKPKSLKQRLEAELGKEAEQCIKELTECIARLKRAGKEAKELGKPSLIAKIGKGLKKAVQLAESAAKFIGPISSIAALL